ncbi:hypothetical protein TNCV_987761 [Trichonephila clavipes]|nr:hypothetical protein TNCV_987761 [Trichonephila clavipes]
MKSTPQVKELMHAKYVLTQSPPVRGVEIRRMGCQLRSAFYTWSRFRIIRNMMTVAIGFRNLGFFASEGLSLN